VPASVKGFGAVFTDVDLAFITQIQFFGTSNNLLHAAFVPPGTVRNQSLSFLGAVGDAGDKSSVCGLPAATHRFLRA
jgi:hypothetical protein